MKTWVAALVAVMLTACNSSNGASSDAHTDGKTEECTAGATQCNGTDQIETCITGPSGTSWSTAPCGAPMACLDGVCSASCTDECNLGDTRTSPSNETCSLWSVPTQTTIMAGSGMEDRARGYNAYLRKNGMPAGQVTYMEYADATLATLTGYGDQGDAAIFTGTYLAAEALRYKATKSPDALANVTLLVQTLHTLWNVAGTGSPGYLARFAAPTNSSSAILTSSFSNTDSFDHFNASYAGGTYNWKGHISRDQYQGVILGYSLAYDVLTDDTVKDLIRTDMVTFVTELMKMRSLKPTIDGVPSPVAINVQYVVMTDQEPLSISITANDETLSGIQEFMPKLFGLYPEPTAAIQLTSAFEVALQVTNGVPAWATQNATIQSFFVNNVNDWLNVASEWVYNKNCGNSYFANNIAFEPMFDLARLDNDPTRTATIRSTILENAMWSNGVINDKNSWFAYIYAANAPASSALAPAAVSMANTQLAQFTAAPRIHVAVNNSTITQDPSCSGQSPTALDVSQRVINDFEWQRGAWQLADAGNPKEVYPGVDFLAAYWLARSQGYLQNDAPTECTRWLPTP